MVRLGGPIDLKAAEVAAKNDMSTAGYDPERAARMHREKGYKSAYAPHIDYRDSVLVKATREAFKKEDVMLAEVGYWKNLMDTDPATRAKHRQEMVEALFLAEELQARCTVDTIGSYHHGGIDSGHCAEAFSQKAFEEAVDLTRSVIDAVNPKTSYFTYELYPFNHVDTPENTLKMLKAVDRKQFGVHFDLVNLINCPRRIYDTEGLIKETIDLLGPNIVCGHIKDLTLEQPSISVLFHEVLAGTGLVNIGAFIREVDKLSSKLGKDIPLLLEHLNSMEEYDQAANNVRKAALAEGVSL